MREVPPHWEERVDERVIRERCGEADLVVLLTDETGHQEQDLLRKLQIGFCPSQGGPTRVLYELATVLASR